MFVVVGGTVIKWQNAILFFPEPPIIRDRSQLDANDMKTLKPIHVSMCEESDSCV